MQPTSNLDERQSNRKAWGQPGLFLSRLPSLFLDLVFPPRCVGCGRIDTVWCATCQAETEAQPLLDEKRLIPPLVTVGSTAWHEGKLQAAVQALKYENGQSFALPLGRRMSAYLAEQDWKIDSILPVPLHTRRLKERGYNQSRLLAEVIAHTMTLHCELDALQRIRYTTSQVGMSGAERLTNVADAFEADPALVTNRTLLLIDDVCTTGSTLKACGQALLDAGAAAVYGLTVTAARH
jgi:ComF family protein